MGDPGIESIGRLYTVGPKYSEQVPLDSLCTRKDTCLSHVDYSIIVLLVELLNKSPTSKGDWLAQSVEHVTLDLGVLSSAPC